MNWSNGAPKLRTESVASAAIEWIEPPHAALDESQGNCDVVLLSGGSSLGARDHSVAAMLALPGAEILAHGIAMSPGSAIRASSSITSVGSLGPSGSGPPNWGTSWSALAVNATLRLGMLASHASA